MTCICIGVTATFCLPHNSLMAYSMAVNAQQKLLLCPLLLVQHLSRHPSQRASFLQQTYAGGAQTVSLLSLRVQVKYIFGYSQYVVPATKTVKAHTVTFPRHDPIQEQLRDLLGHQWTPYFHWREFIMGGTFLVILIAMKHIGRRYPK